MNLMRKWPLDTATKRDPKLRQALHEFETRERRPVRLEGGTAPVPVVQPIREFRVPLEYDGRLVLTLQFQNAPPILTPADVFQAAFDHSLRFPKGSLEHHVLIWLTELSQDWPKRSWEQVFAQLQVPVQGAARALTSGFTVNVERMRE